MTDTRAIVEAAEREARRAMAIQAVVRLRRHPTAVVMTDTGYPVYIEADRADRSDPMLVGIYDYDSATLPAIRNDLKKFADGWALAHDIGKELEAA